MTETVTREIPTIENSIESTRPEDYRTVTERYYSKFYCLDEDRERRHDILVLNHSNRICLITLAPTHPVIARGLKITNINFEVNKKTDRKANKTSGKSKKGGQTLEHTSILAIIETETENFSVKVGFSWLRVIILKASLFRPLFRANSSASTRSWCLVRRSCRPTRTQRATLPLSCRLRVSTSQSRVTWLTVKSLGSFKSKDRRRKNPVENGLHRQIQ